MTHILTFYRHCKNLKPEYAKAARELKGKFKLGQLDATVHTSTAQEFGVQGCKRSLDYDKHEL